MSSNLRVDRILPSTGTEVGVGTATGSVALYGDVNVAGTLTYEDVTNIDSVGVVTARSGLHVTGGNLAVGHNNPSVNLHVKGSASNGQIYLGGTGAHSQIYADNDGVLILNADQSNSAANSYLGFNVDNTERLRIRSDGRIAIGTQTINTDSMLSIHRSSSDQSQIRFTNTTTGEGGNNGLIVGIDNNEHGRIFNLENHPLRFGTNNTERLRISSGGDIGVNTIAPSTKLHVVGDLTLQNASNNGNTWTFYKNSSRTYIVGLRGSSGNALSFYDLTSGTDAERMRIASNGQVFIGNYDTHSSSSIHGNLEVNGNDGINISNATRTGTNGVQWRLIPHNGGGSATNLRLYENAGGTEVINITKNGFVNIGGDFTQTSRKVVINGGSNVGQLEVKGTEADIWMNSSGPSGGSIWRVMGATGNNTHRWRVYDVTNSRDCINVINDGSVVTPAQPRFLARLTANTTYNPSGFGNHVDFDTEDYDIGGNFTTSGADQGLFTAPVTGNYAFNAATYAPGVLQTQSWFVVNGSRKVATDWVPNQSGNFVQNFQIIYLSAGDKVGFHPHRGGTSSFQINANTHHSYFKGCLLG